MIYIIKNIYRVVLVKLIIILCITGCNNVKVKHYIVGKKPPICSKSYGNQKSIIYWGTAWRDDQKEKDLREKYIEDGIRDFFNKDNCFKVVKILRESNGKDSLLATDYELINKAKKDKIDKIVKFRIEELGPNLYISLSPILWGTENEVTINTKILNVKTDKIESDITTNWKRGGAYTINGSKKLPTDFQSALERIFIDIH